MNKMHRLLVDSQRHQSIGLDFLKVT